MTIHQEDDQAPSESSLLTPQEQAVCKQIADGAAPHSQHALALLALNEGSTQANAAVQAGLSPGQVKYWAAKFRKLRMGIFPDYLQEEPEVEADATLAQEIEEEPEPVTEKADPAEAKTKEPKVKKEKKAKKEKQSAGAKKAKKKPGLAKKDEKGKGGKKTKKKTRKKVKKAKKGKKNKKAKKTKKRKKGKKGKKSKKTK